MSLALLMKRDAELRQRESDERDIDAAQPAAREPRRRPPTAATTHNGEDEIEPDRDAELQRRDRRHVGADTEEGDMGEIEDTGIAERQVPVGGDDGIEDRKHGEVLRHAPQSAPAARRRATASTATMLAMRAMRSQSLVMTGAPSSPSGAPPARRSAPRTARRGVQ